MRICRFDDNRVGIVSGEGIRVGPVRPGDVMLASIERLGAMRVEVT